MDDPWYSKLVVSTPGPTTETAAKTMLDVHTASSESQREVIALQRKILEVEFSAGRQTLERDFSILLNDLFTRFSNAEIRLLHSSLGEVQQLRNDDRFTCLSMVSVFGTFMQTVKNWDSFTVNALRRFVNDLVTINCDTFATLSAERAEAVTRSELINDLEERLIKFQILHCNDKSMSSEQNVQSTPSSSSEDHSPHDLTSLKGVNLRLQNEVNTLTTSLMKEREHTTLLTCQLSDLEESVAQIRSESNVIEIERNEFNARVVELEKQVESVANALKEARSSNEKLQQQSRDYHNMYLRQLDETEHLSQSFEKLHSSYNEKIETELSFEKYVNGGSNDDPSVDFSNEVQNLKKKVREQAQTISAQQLKMQDIEIELDMFRTGVPLRHEMVQLEQHLAESNEECENLHQELDVTLRELSEERVHVARITSRIMELESSIVTNKSIQEEIERNLELERTRSEELKRALSNLEHSGTVVNSERGRLESELSTLKRQLTEEQLKSRTASHRATQLEQELNLLTQELENALRTCSNERAVSAQVTSRVRELESLIASMKSDNYKSHSNPQDVSSSGQHSTGPRIGSNNTGMENVDAM